MAPKKEIKKLFAKADSIYDKKLSRPRTKLADLQSKIWDGVETGFLLSDFAQGLCPINAEVPAIYSTLLDAADISPTLIWNQNTRRKERRDFTSEAAKIVH